ncbi:MAG: dTDP-4-dehydrorhamnose reductase [Myxococcales bacterium]|nr:dTDP-4-dehydrorhamnose reductase [Myxococcales bacterium]
MKFLVTGASGQVGWELSRSLLPLGEVIAVDQPELDLSRPESIQPTLDTLRPDVIVNAAAYTAVDKAETDEALATTVNGHAVGELAGWARRNKALVVHYSTDYVFDGTGVAPYVESAETHPINAYGRSKLAGERALAQVGSEFLCLRTSWVYANRGSNFFLTMLRLGRDREHLRVVADQLGTPNWAPSIADVTAQILAKATARRLDGRFVSAIYHLSGRGICSWHHFAERIFEGARSNGHPLKVAEVVAIPASEYPTPASRPAYSGLCGDALANDYQVQLPDWRAMLAQAIKNLSKDRP